MTNKRYRNYLANEKFRKIHGYPKGWNPHKYGRGNSPRYHYPELSESETKDLLGEE